MASERVRTWERPIETSKEKVVWKAMVLVGVRNEKGESVGQFKEEREAVGKDKKLRERLKTGECEGSL
ncbi:hypothetical protein J6590_036256 [Homalodisca vitripennis]|nr:hypothetical protein J6590_036256 [Homalodisca vitripennis]